MNSFLLFTPRLVLRTPTADDADVYTKIFSNPENLKYEPHGWNPSTNVEALQKRIQSIFEGRSLELLICLRDPTSPDQTVKHGRVIGLAGFNSFVKSPTEDSLAADTGILIDAGPDRHQHFGSEVLESLLDWCFEHPNVARDLYPSSPVPTPAQQLGKPVSSAFFECLAGNESFRGFMKALGVPEEIRENPKAEIGSEAVFNISKDWWHHYREQKDAQRRPILVPINLHDPIQASSLREQRVECGWKSTLEIIKKWRSLIDAGVKTFFWITLPGTDVPVGHISLQRIDDPKERPPLEAGEPDGHVMTIDSFFIDPRRQSEGCGRMVMDVCEDWAKGEPFGYTDCRGMVINGLDRRHLYDMSDDWYGIWEKIGMAVPRVCVEDWYRRRGYVFFKTGAPYTQKNALDSLNKMPGVGDSTEIQSVDLWKSFNKGKVNGSVV